MKYTVKNIKYPEPYFLAITRILKDEIIILHEEPGNQ
jgi:hypothetical protein